MKTTSSARELALFWVILPGLLSIVACGGSPASMTPINPMVVVEGPPGAGAVTIPPNIPFHFAALPLRSMQNGAQISFNAPWPTALKVILTDPTGTNVQLQVITASESPADITKGFARTDSIDATPTPAFWKVTVRPPDSFYALGTFTVQISVVSLNSSFTGTQHESPPLKLVLQTFQVNVAITGGGPNPGGAAVTSNPAGIACNRPQGSCTHDFGPPTGAASSIVQLIPNSISADATTCFTFLGWTGSCAGAGSGTCTLPLDGNQAANVGASFDAGQPCNPQPAICTAPQKSMPLCQASVLNSSGIASCDDGGWFCCSAAAPAKAGSGCLSGSGPAYGAVQCTVGTPSAKGCQ